MFEPIGGSAPKYTGQNVINPLAAICSGALMLEHLGENEAAKAIEDTVISVTREKIKDLGAGRMATPPQRSATSWPLRFKKNAHHFVESRLRAGSLRPSGVATGQAAPILPPPLGKLIATMATSGSLLHV